MNADERFDRVDQRMDTLEGSLRTVAGEVGEMRGEVHSLRVLTEANTSQMQQLAEVQHHHGMVLAQHSAQLERITVDLAALRDVPAIVRQISADLAALTPIADFATRAADDHERPISALERRGPS
jgi:hypothetical protein